MTILYIIVCIINSPPNTVCSSPHFHRSASVCLDIFREGIFYERSERQWLQVAKIYRCRFGRSCGEDNCSNRLRQPGSRRRTCETQAFLQLFEFVRMERAGRRHQQTQSNHKYRYCCGAMEKAINGMGG